VFCEIVRTRRARKCMTPSASLGTLHALRVSGEDTLAICESGRKVIVTATILWQDWTSEPPSPTVCPPCPGTEWVAYGHPADQALLCQLQPAHFHPLTDPGAIAVIPLGFFGQQLWKELDWPAAVLAAVVRGEAIFLQSPGAPPAASARQFFERLRQISEGERIIHLAIRDDSRSAGFPALAPSDHSIPAWVRQAMHASISGESVAKTALRAGILQIHDDLTGSHEFSQSIEGAGSQRLGDYWHAIMHRREPDYGNARYWCRRIQTPQVTGRLAQLSRSLFDSSGLPEARHWAGKCAASENWNPAAFVDLCESLARSPVPALDLLARKIQWLEMLLLLQVCCAAAR